MKQDHTVLLTVIVPIAAGDSAWQTLLPQLAGLPANSEVLLVHAGSAITAAWPYPPGLQVQAIASTSGRARQMNVGAKLAKGRWLWFLHADSGLLTDTLPALLEWIAQDTAALAYFDLRFQHDGPGWVRLNAWGANLRSHWLGLPFGDQGLLLPAAWFRRLGGYNEILVRGEDHRLVWKARQAGLPRHALGVPLSTSARRYAEHGWWGTTIQHLWRTAGQAWTGWRQGLSPARLQRRGAWRDRW